MTTTTKTLAEVSESAELKGGTVTDRKACER